MQTCIKHRTSLFVMQKWHCHGHQGQILRKLRGLWWLFYHKVQGLSEMLDEERVWDLCCEQREEKQITEHHLHESLQGAVKLKRPSVIIHKHVQFSLWTILQVSQVHRQELIVSCTVKLWGDLLKSTVAVCGIVRAHSGCCVFLWRTPALSVRSMCRTRGPVPSTQVCQQPGPGGPQTYITLKDIRGHADLSQRRILRSGCWGVNKAFSESI
jgi:hypothetical protein